MKPSSVFLADFIYYAIWALALLFVLTPYFALRFQHASEAWQLAALAFGGVLLVPAFWVINAARKRFPETFEFIGAARIYAKQHRDLSMEGKNLSALEYACFGILAIIVVAAAVASSVLVIRAAALVGGGLFRNEAAIAAFAASFLVLMPALLTGARMSLYFGVRIAAKISGRDSKS